MNATMLLVAYESDEQCHSLVPIVICYMEARQIQEVRTQKVIYHISTLH